MSVICPVFSVRLSRRCVCYPQRSWYHGLSSPAAPERTDKHPKQANNHSSSFRDGQEPRLSRKSMFTVRGAKLGRHDTAESTLQVSRKWLHHMTRRHMTLTRLDAASRFFFNVNPMNKTDQTNKKTPCKVIKSKQTLFNCQIKIFLYPLRRIVTITQHNCGQTLSNIIEY